MHIYVYSDRVYFQCKAKDLCKLIHQFAEQYSTVKELINAKAIKSSYPNKPALSC
ncbi:hypothetical protein [Desulforamulus aquiferis]|uniref:Uncharacterized protein n=1 Tax=Desulforamulus aquiferis TaxID=1397668 RepID=A0AAW7ZAC5_9FIRM|nr:hypothetical protein [Desulforamulus aquiferis]MDO7786425.1 hypothetical protein [Desulforamulus aquiferis]